MSNNPLGAACSGSDSCCSGQYNYNIRVGRSTAVTGPYVDKAGIQLMQGGGTLLVAGNASWVAPGHNSVIAYGDKTYNIYHALTAGNMRATLRIAASLSPPKCRGGCGRCTGLGCMLHAGRS